MNRKKIKWTKEQLILAHSEAMSKHNFFQKLGFKQPPHKGTLALKKVEDMLLELNLTYPEKQIYNHTDETKIVLSEKRKKYLSDNKDKHNWSIYHKKQSQPEKLFGEALLASGITSASYYIPPESERLFELDFALPELKIAFEINGNQHYQSDGSLAPYYQERHNYLVSIGWTIHEIHYLECFEPETLSNIISNALVGKECYSTNPEIINYALIRKEKVAEKKKPKERKSWRKGKVFPERWKVAHPSKEELEKLLWEKSTIEIAKSFGVSDNAVARWAKQYGLAKPPRGYWSKVYAGKKP